MITENNQFAEAQADGTVPAEQFAMSVAPRPDDGEESESDVFEIHDPERLLRADLGTVSFLQEEEERALTLNARQAWQHILHTLSANMKLIASLRGETVTTLNLNTLREGDLLELLANLRRHRELRRSTQLGERTDEELHCLLYPVQDDLARFRACRNELIRRNLPLVLRFAQQHHVLGVAYLDLVQEGVLGLMRAVEKLDPDKGVRFTT